MRVRYQSYDYTEAGKAVRVTIPEGIGVVRGLLVVGPGGGGDSRDQYREGWFGAFLGLHDFAYLGTRGFTSHAEDVRVMQNALQQFAATAKRPELAHAPYVATGFSAGGGFASRLLVEVPERVIAVAVAGSRLNLTGITPTAAHLATPACLMNGEHESDGLAQFVEPVLARYRPKGALWSWMMVPDGYHFRRGQETLGMPLLDAVVRLRYPADSDVRRGPVKLKRLDPRSGWLAENTSWRSGLTAIAAASDFKGEVARSSWLPNEDIACIYRAYSTLERPLTLIGPRSASETPWDTGSSVALRVDVSRFPGWASLQLFDGARKVGELSLGPAEFRVTDLQPGYHGFSVLGVDRSGAIRTSNPVLVVVQK